MYILYTHAGRRHCRDHELSKIVKSWFRWLCATVDEWNEYGKAAMAHARCVRVGKETANRHGEFNGGHWIYTGNTTSFLRYIPQMPRCADYVDVAATLDAAQSLAATFIGARATPRAPVPDPTPRAPGRSPSRRPSRR